MHGQLGQRRLVFGGPAEADPWTVVDCFGDHFAVTRVYATAGARAEARGGVQLSISPAAGRIDAHGFTSVFERSAIGEPGWGLVAAGRSVTFSASASGNALDQILTDLEAELMRPSFVLAGV
jgi:hypothetical protein